MQTKGSSGNDGLKEHNNSAWSYSVNLYYYILNYFPEHASY